MKVFIYVMTKLFEDEETQRRGCVAVFFQEGRLQPQDPSMDGQGRV